VAGGLDLTGVQRTVEGWLVDDLAIARDNGVSDDDLDPETLLITPNPDEAVWEGQGAVQPLTGDLSQSDPDVARIIEETRARYRALLPLGVETGARLYDVLTVAAVHGKSADPRLAGRRFVIVALGEPSSFAAVQFLYLRPLDTPPAG
jgi:hypothetical protein